ncbi:MAG: hypothetical protein H8E25_12095 [Planctomycetes bacterium]|nr:hypothetical protein [Planctomycetota bacterium]
MKIKLAPWLTVLILVIVACCSWQMRVLSSANQSVSNGSSDWYTVDSDGMYHMRRLSEYRQGDGMPAAVDEFLNYPYGAIIPWPPYYTMVADLLVADDDSQIEMQMGSLPFYFSILTSVMVALAALIIAGRGAAAVAGLLHAFNFGAAHYGGIGVADHHAFVSLLNVLVLFCFSILARYGGLSSVRFCLATALVAGAAVGLMLGVWVGSLMYLLPLQLLCLWWLYNFYNRKVALFVSAFHLTALLALLPAILQSPWTADYPWIVINLSYFHLLWLGLGVLLPLPVIWSPSVHITRRYMHYCLAVCGVFALIAFIFNIPPAPGIIDGFAWVSRVDEFMSGIAESSPLLGSGSLSFSVWVGWSVVLLPFAYWYSARRNKFATPMLLPWLVALPPLLIQACAQMRFADALSAPLSLVAAVTLCYLLSRSKASNLMKSFAAIGFVAIVQLPSITEVFNYSKQHNKFQEVANAEHHLFTWIAQQQADPRSVLAVWDFGHTIEWTAKRPSIATNFGSYIGRDSFIDPAIFFMTDDFEVAEDVLAKRQVQYIVATSSLPDYLASHAKRIGADITEYREIINGKFQKLNAKWFKTIAAQIYNFGDADGATGPAPSIPFLRLVHLSPTIVKVAEQLGKRTSAGRIWEYVPGAIVTGSSHPGRLVNVEIDFAFFDNGEKLVSNKWTSSVVCGADGNFSLRIPYCSGSNRDAIVSEMRWSDGVPHVFELSESQVLNGETVRLK